MTGGASGIGPATARLLAARGARVAVLDLDAGTVEAPLLGFTADVADDASVRAAVTAAAEALGGLDILVNNAGIGATGARTSRAGSPTTPPATRCTGSGRQTSRAGSTLVEPPAADTELFHLLEFEDYAALIAELGKPSVNTD